jgi:hypothetical protein
MALTKGDRNVLMEAVLRAGLKAAECAARERTGRRRDL